MSFWTQDPLLACSSLCEVLGSRGIGLISVCTTEACTVCPESVGKVTAYPMSLFLEAFHCTRKASVAILVLILRLKADVWLNNSDVALPTPAEQC